MDQLSERELAEEVNSERGPSGEQEWVRWGLSLGAASLQCQYRVCGILFGQRKEWLMPGMASFTQMASLLSRFLGYVKS